MDVRGLQHDRVGDTADLALDRLATGKRELAERALVETLTGLTPGVAGGDLPALVAALVRMSALKAEEGGVAGLR